MNRTRLFFSTFALVFLAELGDKTQIAGFSMSAAGRPWLSVFLGAALALTASTLLAVTLGGFIARRIPARLLRTLSGGLFLATGAYLVYSLLSA